MSKDDLKYDSRDIEVSERLVRLEARLDNLDANQQLNLQATKDIKNSIDTLATSIQNKDKSTDTEISNLKVDTAKLKVSFKYLKLGIFVLITMVSPSLVNTIGKFFL